jgi:aminopeptidase N
MKFAVRAICYLAASAAAIGSAPVSAEGGKPPITLQTQNSGGPLDPAQMNVRFDTGDLQIEVFPETESIAGIATLNFTAKAAIKTLVVDLDRNLPVTAVAIDGVALKSGAWRNPEGRMTIRLGKTVAKGAKVSAIITYGGTPHVAVRAPWDGGFVWSKTKAGQPWIATAVQGEGCDLFWPCIDYPTYEPDQLDIHITVPKGLKAPSNGVFQGKADLASKAADVIWRGA